MRIKEYSPIDSLGESSYRSISPAILYRANKSTLDQREREAISFVKDIVKVHAGRRPVVSFSGGKDSLVVSYIVRKALCTDKVLHMFSNTTMEYPDNWTESWHDVKTEPDYDTRMAKMKALYKVIYDEAIQIPWMYDAPRYVINSKVHDMKWDAVDINGYWDPVNTWKEK